MVNFYIPQPKASENCDWCKKGKKHKYICVDDYTKVTTTVKTICKKCDRSMAKLSPEQKLKRL